MLGSLLGNMELGISHFSRKGNSEVQRDALSTSKMAEGIVWTIWTTRCSPADIILLLTQMRFQGMESSHAMALFAMGRSWSSTLHHEWWLKSRLSSGRLRVITRMMLRPMMLGLVFLTYVVAGCWKKQASNQQQYQFSMQVLHSEQFAPSDF